MGLIKDIFTGQIKAERARNKYLTQLYEGGKRTRERNSSSATFTGPEDIRETTERLQMIREMRDMENDFPLVSLILDTFEVYGLGTIRYQPTTGDVDTNREISEWINHWMQNCDASRRFDFQTLSRLALRCKKRDGECGFIHRTDGDEYRLQLVSGDQIGDPTIITFSTQGNRNGIVIDTDTGEPIKYEIYRREPDLYNYVKELEVPADHFSHVFDPFRIEQYHGVTAFKSVITRLRDLKEVMDASRLNIKYRSQQLPFFRTESGENPFSANAGYDDTAPVALGKGEENVSLQRIQNAEQMFLKTTEGVFEFPNDFPNQQFLPWVNTCIKEIMSGVKVAFEFSWGLTDATGTVGRLVVERQDRVMQLERANLERQFMRKAIRRAIRHGYDTGAIKRDSASKYEGIFFYGPRITADYGRDARADIELVDAGLLTETEYQHIHGRDPETIRSLRLSETMNLIDDGKEIADTAGISIPNAVNLLRGQYSNPPQSQTVSESKSTSITLEEEEQEGQIEELSAGYKPTSEMASAAQRALNRRAELVPSKRGMTDTGIARARDISNRRNLSEETVRAMSAWFARHESTSRNSPNYSQREKAWVAWNGWGGDAGRKWADRIIEQLDKNE